MKHEEILKILELAIAATELAARARAVYDKAREQAERDHELTPEQSADLDARGEAAFNSPASQPSGR